MHTVDSDDRTLKLADVVLYGLENIKGDIPTQQALPALIEELNGPNCITKQIGNTLFIVHPGEDGKGYFRALNADAAHNYIKNSGEFLRWAKKELHMNFLTTQFRGPEVETITKYFKKKPPIPGMQHVLFQMKNGEMRLVLLLDPKKV